MADPLAFPSVYDAPGLDEEERKRQERFRSQFADPFAAPDPADRIKSTMSAAFAPGFAPAGTQPFASPFAVPRPAPPVIDQDKLAAVFPTAGLNPSQAAQMATEARGDIPGTPGLGAGRQVAVQMGPYNQFLHTIDDVGGQTVKQVGAPPVVTDPLEKVRQVFRDRQANGPNMGFDAAGQMAGAQLSTLDEAMRGQTAIDVARAKHELDNNPAALRTKAYSNVFGAVLADTGDANAAHAGAVKAAAAFNPGAPTPAGPVTSSTDISPKAFTKQNLDILPTAFSYQGPGDKVAYRGQAEAFGPKQTAELVSRMMLLPEDQQKLELAKLMNSPAGPQISNALAARFGSAYADHAPEGHAPRRGHGDGARPRRRGEKRRPAVDRPVRPRGPVRWDDGPAVQAQPGRLEGDRPRGPPGQHRHGRRGGGEEDHGDGGAVHATVLAPLRPPDPVGPHVRRRPHILGRSERPVCLPDQEPG
jgi:hypothetical protein